MDRKSGEPTDRTRHGESRLAMALWPGISRNAEQFWEDGQETVPSRTARLAGSLLHRAQLERQRTTPVDYAFGGLSTGNSPPRSRPSEARGSGGEISVA